MGGPVSSLSEEGGKDSTADGGQGDKQVWWEVKVLRQRPANSGKFELRLQHLNSFITVGRFSGAADLLPLSPDFLLEA